MWESSTASFMRLFSQIFLLVACSDAVIAHQAPDAQAAQQALDRGEYQRAEQIYRGLNADGASSPELLNNLGIALHFEGKSSEAIRVFLQVLKAKQLPSRIWASITANFASSMMRRRFCAKPNDTFPILTLYPFLARAIWKPGSHWTPWPHTRRS
jgi:hypothetical protein